MGLLSRRKGKVWEREVARRFREVLPGCHVRRGLQSRDGAEAADVEGVPYFWIECKHQALPNIAAALQQARDASTHHERMVAGRALEANETASARRRWPIAVVKRNRAEPLVAMGFDDFLALVREWGNR